MLELRRAARLSLDAFSVRCPISLLSLRHVVQSTAVIIIIISSKRPPGRLGYPSCLFFQRVDARKDAPICLAIALAASWLSCDFCCHFSAVLGPRHGLSRTVGDLPRWQLLSRFVLEHRFRNYPALPTDGTRPRSRGLVYCLARTNKYHEQHATTLHAWCV
jgi:hypothetical protein